MIVYFYCFVYLLLCDWLHLMKKLIFDRVLLSELDGLIVEFSSSFWIRHHHYHHHQQQYKFQIEEAPRTKLSSSENKTPLKSSTWVTNFLHHLKINFYFPLPTSLFCFNNIFSESFCKNMIDFFLFIIYTIIVYCTFYLNK